MNPIKTVVIKIKLKLHIAILFCNSICNYRRLTWHSWCGLGGARWLPGVKPSYHILEYGVMVVITVASVLGIFSAFRPRPWAAPVVSGHRKIIL